MYMTGILVGINAYHSKQGAQLTCLINAFIHIRTRSAVEIEDREFAIENSTLEISGVRKKRFCTSNIYTNYFFRKPSSGLD